MSHAHPDSILYCMETIYIYMYIYIYTYTYNIYIYICMYDYICIMNMIPGEL